MRLRHASFKLVLMLCILLPACQSAVVDPSQRLDAQPGAAEFRQYLLQLESSVRFEAQSPQWTRRRIDWIADVERANTIRRLGDLIIEFEREIVGAAQAPEWFQGNRRAVWIQRMRMARSIPEMAGLLVEVESSINFSAQFETWRSRRPEWVAGVRALQGVQSRSPEPAAQPTFAQLLIELETSVLFEAQSPRWRVRRAQWIAETRGAGSDVRRLKSLLVEFEREVMPSAHSREWNSGGRAAWMQRVGAASSVRDLSALMIEVEASINYAAQVNTWRFQRENWIARARDLQRTGYGEFY